MKLYEYECGGTPHIKSNIDDKNIFIGIVYIALYQNSTASLHSLTVLYSSLESNLNLFPYLFRHLFRSEPKIRKYSFHS
jgi:hypothetical protein